MHVLRPSNDRIYKYATGKWLHEDMRGHFKELPCHRLESLSLIHTHTHTHTHTLIQTHMKLSKCTFLGTA